MNTTQAMDTMPGKAIDFPIPRSCPFHPPNEFKAVQRQPALARVKLWNGNEAWLVTRHEEFRAVLKEKRISADKRQPNFPSTATPASAPGAAWTQHPPVSINPMMTGWSCC